MSPSSPASESSINKKKRNRLSLSCNYCKKRKVKCDRGRPCGACRRYNVADQCDYPGHIWRSEDLPGGVGIQTNGISDTPQPQQTNGSQYAFMDGPLYSDNLKHQNEKEVYNHGNKIPPMASFAAPPNGYLGHPSNGSGSSSSASNIPTSVYSELESLKDKIKQLEASITVTNLSQASPGSTVTQYSTSESRSHHSDSADRQRDGATPSIPKFPNRLLSPHLELDPSVSSPGSPSVFDNTPSKWQANGSAAKAESNVRNEKKAETSLQSVLGVNLYDENDPNETINFYSGYTPIHVKDRSRRINHGPHSWLSLLKHDYALRSLWDYLRLTQSKRSDVIAPLAVKLTESRHGSEHDNSFTAKALDQDGYDDVEPYSEKQQHHHSSSSAKSDNSDTFSREARIQMNRHAIALGLTVFEGKIDQELHLVERIRVLLPKQKVIWILVNLYFTSLYPYISLIDEKFFKAEVVRIIGPEDYRDAPVPFCKIEKRLDFALVGILLIVLRFAYLSKFSNKYQANARIIQSNDFSVAQTKYLLTNPINIDVISLAQLCLDQFDLTRKTNVSVLQCALFMRIYRMFSPEDGDGADGGDSQIYNGMLVQMAYSMGINREPDLFPEVCPDERENNLMRKIWYYLRINDITHACQYGNPMSIDNLYADVKLPFNRPGNENISDTFTERILNESFQQSVEPYELLKELLQSTLGIKNELKLRELTASISNFELKLDASFGSLSDFTRTPSVPDMPPFLKIKKCKVYLNFKLFTMTLYYHLFLFYEKRKKLDLTFFYIKKIMVICYSEFLPEFLELISNNHLHFDPNSTIADLILNPSVQTMIHKSAQFSFAVLIRLNSTIFYFKKDARSHGRLLLEDQEYKLNYAKLCKLSKLVERFCRFSIGCMSRLSGRYYYAWRITKAHTHIMNHLISEQFYQQITKDTQIEFPQFRDDQLNELISIADATLKKIKEVIDVDFKDAELRSRIEEGKYGTFAPQGKYNDHKEGLSSVGSPATDRLQSSFFGPSQPQQQNTFFVPMNSASPASNASFDIDNFNVQDNLEIDKLWLQMASMKNDNTDLNDQAAVYNAPKNDVSNNALDGVQIMTDQVLQQQQPFTPGSGLNLATVPTPDEDGQLDFLARFSFDQLYNF